MIKRFLFSSSKYHQSFCYLIDVLLKEREYFGRTLSTKHLPSSDLYQRMNMRLKVAAHKASVYCVVFDRTGTYALSVRLRLFSLSKDFLFVFFRVLMIFF